MCYEDGVNPDPNILQATTFSISNGQFYKTLKMLANDSYIDEITFTTTKTGIVVGGLDSCSITIKGLEYLADNTKMKQVYKILKEAREWLPLIK